ncbi:hypothetical protein K501DRAFT_281408 [Backusella circina FSU 941]|nr:hypothetical protein K501DRAFT_281408 [Backusella circina FSU 941]
MGLVDKIKNSIGYYKVDKYTKRRLSQSQFESHDRRYYENAYCNGDYVEPGSNQYKRTSYLSYRDSSRWSLPDLLKKSNKKPGVAALQLKTSENYNLGRG